jgi:hypothetical protein
MIVTTEEDNNITVAVGKKKQHKGRKKMQLTVRVVHQPVVPRNEVHANKKQAKIATWSAAWFSWIFLQ